MALGKNLSWCFSLVIWRSPVIGFSLHAYCCGSVAQVCPTLWPHGLRHAKLPCPSLSPGACSNWCPLSRRCHPTMSSSVPLFSFCLQSFPASGSFPRSWLFVSVAELLELQLHHQSFQWILGLHAFRIDWFHLLTVQGTLKIFIVGCGILTCSLWVLVPWPGIKPRPLTLGVLATGPPGKAPSCALDGLPSVPVCVLISSWKNTSYIGWRLTLMTSF